MTTETPKKGGCFGRSIVTVIIVLIVACVVCGVVGYFVVGPSVMNVVNTFAAPLTTSNDFMTALTTKDYAKAYGLVHPSQQEAFGGSPEGMQQKLDSGGMLPTTFALTNIQIGTDAIVNGTGTFNGNQKYVYISLRKDGDNWKIIGLDVNDNAPTATPASK
jgi:hypothetical protein